MTETGRVVIVRGGTQGFAQDITIGPHHLTADEPVSFGGTDRGPDAYQLIAAALGA
jgi:putative redox protein